MKTTKISTALAIVLLFSLGSCKKKCSDSAACELIPDPGVCEAYFPKYYFDQEEGKCKEFIWGGCDGVVPFDTLEECKECECWH